MLVDTLIGLSVIDTGAQFPDPGPGYGGASNCTTCAVPTINMNDGRIYDDAFFPGETWDVRPAQWWGSWATVAMKWEPSYSTNPHSGKFCAAAAMQEWGLMRFGCNVPTPTAQVSHMELWARVDSGTYDKGVWWFNDGSIKQPLPTTITTTWTLIVLPVADDTISIGNAFNSFSLQNTGSVRTLP